MLFLLFVSGCWRQVGAEDMRTNPQPPRCPRCGERMRRQVERVKDEVGHMVLRSTGEYQCPTLHCQKVVKEAFSDAT